MTVQSVTPALIPDPIVYGQMVSGTVAYTAFLIDAAAEKIAVVFRVPKDGNLARVGFRTGTVTTGDTLKVSFQDLDTTTGNPDGVVDQFRTQVVADVDDNVWFRTGLMTSDGTDTGTLRVVTRGQAIAAVIEFNAYVAGNLNIVHHSAANNFYLFGGYVTHFTAAWAKSILMHAVLAVEYSDGTFAYIPSTLPADTKTSTNFNTGSTPDEIALKFRLPVPVRVLGFWIASAISGDFNVVLYDSDGTTPLATFVGDKDTATTSTAAAAFSAPFSSSVSLLANTFYRLALLPTTASNISRVDFTVPSTPGVAQLDQISGGQDFHWSQRTDAGAWSDTTTKRPVMGLILDGLDDGVSTGGISRAAVVNTGGL